MKGKRKYVVIVVTIVFLSCIIGLFIKLTKKEEPVLPQFAVRREHSLGTWLKSHPDAGYRGYLDLEKNDYGVVYISSYKCRKIDLDFLEGIYGKKAISYVWTEGTSEELQEVLALVQKQEQAVDVYLEVDVLALNGLELAETLGNYSKGNMYVYFTPYSSEEWEEFELLNMADEITFYQKEFVQDILELEHLMFLSFNGEAWMAYNPLFYKDPRSLSPDAVYQIYSAFEAELERRMENKLTAQNIEEKLSLQQHKKNNYIDMQGKTIFYLGDSMYGKDKNESGIAEIVSDFLNVKGYNLSIMGTGISGNATSDLTNMVDILIHNNGDNLSEIEIPEVIAKEVEETHNMIPHYIVLRYGYNDYSARALESENPQLASKLADNIKRLQERFPTTKIIVSTPTMSGYDLGHEVPLKDYVDEIIKVCEQLGVPYLNNYDVDVFVEESINDYLIDGVHYNVRGRFAQAERLAEFIQEFEK